MHWQTKRVLVTGAGGFIGSHLAERLVKLRAKVKAFVRYNSRNDYGLLELVPDSVREQIEIIAGDLKDHEAVRRAANDIDIIFHLGALVSIPYSYQHPMDFIQTNVVGTANVLNAAIEQSVEKIVHTSTSEVYGTAQYSPIDEKHPLQAQSPYSASKIATDKLAESYYRSFNLPVAIIRPFNTYGPQQSARAVIPTIITQALTNDIVRLGSLHPTRDLTYIDDTVEGFIKVAESSQAVGEVVNIGSGKEISIHDLTERIFSLLQKNIEVQYDQERVRPPKSEVERLIADNSKAKELLGWEAKISLNEGLEKTIQWISKNINRYKVEVYNV